jgi:hypothetical protein
MDMHFSIVYSGWCFKTNRTTVLHFKIVKSGWWKMEKTVFVSTLLWWPNFELLHYLKRGRFGLFSTKFAHCRL